MSALFDERLPLRFWNKVDVDEDGCWLWIAGRSSDGYARFDVDGDATYGHRHAYEVLVGPVPDGLQLDHLCRVRHCVNPDHLEPVTQLENARRGAHAQATHCRRGHEYTEANTYMRGRKRVCRRCTAMRQTAYQLRIAPQGPAPVPSGGAQST